MMVCPRMTGGWGVKQDRHVWAGERAKDQVACCYTGTPQTLLCHAIVTHRLPLAAAHAMVTALLHQEEFARNQEKEFAR